MIKNYLKVAFRHLYRQPGYTAINIIGLAIGITSSLVILLYLFHELSYDKHHLKADSIYRISSDIKEPDNGFRWAVTQNPLGPKLKEEFAEVEQYVRFVGGGETRFEYENINYFEEKVFFVDSTIFDIFSFQFISGDPATALDAPNSIVLNETVAKKIFKGEDPIGRLIKSDQDKPYQVTGIIEDMPDNSHIIADVLISLTSIPNFDQGNNWGSFGIYTYVLLNDGTTSSEFSKKLEKIIEENVATIFDQFDITVKYEVIGIKDIHLYSDFEGEPEALGNIDYVYIFLAVGIFILLIACINYMNLATARSTKRSLEVGIRKVMGAYKSRLIGQFLTESILLTLVSLVISLLILLLLTPALNGLLNTNLQLIKLTEGPILLVLILIITFTGLVGGSYPAFFLSSFQPTAVLKGKLSSGAGNKNLRKALVTIQFAISIFMLVGTGIIYDQMQFVRSKDLGFDKEQVISFNLGNQKARNKWTVLKSKLLANPNISSASTSTTIPGKGFSKQLFALETEGGPMEEKGVDNYRIDYDYFNTLKIEFEKGRDFSLEFGSDSLAAVIVNEAMVKRMGWTEPIGKKVRLGSQDTLAVWKVIGVVKDFHQQSLYNPIQSLMFIPGFNNGNVLVKIENDLQNTIADVKASWQEVFPTVPFEYSYIDEAFLEQYETDQLRGNLFLGFSFITIIITCLGLMGLASYTTEQRAKEISIRKVLGAKTNGLVSLLVKDFIYLIGIGAVPAFVAAWYVMNEWLDSFEYHIEIGYFIFVLVFFSILILTVGTTGYFALKAANSNPAEKLKYE